MKRAILITLALGCAAKEVKVMPAETKPLSERFKLEKAEKTLGNGLRVVAVKKDKLPIFQVSVRLFAGSALDPKGKEGLASLTQSMLEAGAGQRTRDQISETIEGMGAQLRLSTGRTRVYVSARCLTQDAESLLAVLSDILTKPAFPEGEFAKEKERQISGILSARSNPNTVVGWTFYELLFGDHPIAHPPEGYPESVKEITLKDVKEFYENWYYPKNALVVVVSDLEPESALALVEKFLGSWEAKGKPLPKLPPLPEVKGVRAKVVQMPEVNQAYILLGHPVPFHRGSPDYTPARVANYILGGSGFSSRIVKEVRVKHGYAYSTYSYFMGGFPWDGEPLPGYLQSGVETKLATGNDAIRLIRQLMREAKEKGFTQEELEAAKSYYRGSIARSAETYSQLADMLLTQIDYGLPEFFWIKEIERIQNLSLEEVNEAAKFYQPDHLVIAVVADASFKLEGVPEVEYVRWK